MALIDGTTRIRGAYKPPQLRVYGEDKGVPFTKVFRNKKSLRNLERKQGVVILSVFHLLREENGVRPSAIHN